MVCGDMLAIDLTVLETPRHVPEEATCGLRATTIYLFRNIFN